jgi:hypothetical protein
VREVPVSTRRSGSRISTLVLDGQVLRTGAGFNPPERTVSDGSRAISCKVSTTCRVQRLGRPLVSTIAPPEARRHAEAVSTRRNGSPTSVRRSAAMVTPAGSTGAHFNPPTRTTRRTGTTCKGKCGEQTNICVFHPAGADHALRLRGKSPDDAKKMVFQPATSGSRIETDRAGSLSRLRYPVSTRRSGPSLEIKYWAVPTWPGGAFQPAGADHALRLPGAARRWERSPVVSTRSSRSRITTLSLKRSRREREDVSTRRSGPRIAT